jgi:hypothetical protein
VWKRFVVVAGSQVALPKLACLGDDKVLFRLPYKFRDDDRAIIQDDADFRAFMK